MKNLKIEHIVYTGFDEENSQYKYTVYCEDFIHKFIVEEKRLNDSNFRGSKNEYKIFLDMSLFGSNQFCITLCSSEPALALCDYLQYDYSKFKNDIYASIDKKYFFDFAKTGIYDSYINVPIESVFTPNTFCSDSDTICALLRKEYKKLDGDDSDFTRSVISEVLDNDKLYVQPILDELINHMFYSFLTEDEKKEKPKNRPLHFIHMKDKFERSFKSYDDQIEFKREIEDFEDEDYSIEKIEFTIKHNIHYKNPYKDIDSVSSTASIVFGALTALSSFKKGIDFLKNDKKD